MPSAPPSGVSSVIVNGSSALVSWHPPPRPRTNGRLASYNVWIVENKTHPHSNLTLPGDQLSVTLHNLTLNSDYTAVVAASTR